MSNTHLSKYFVLWRNQSWPKSKEWVILGSYLRLDDAKQHQKQISEPNYVTIIAEVVPNDH